MKKILMIVGSLRRDSFNHQLALAAEKLLENRAQVHKLTYSDLPYMNQDIEFPAPESVARVRAAVQQVDALWIFTPEYNFSFPGVLKNLLDWLSRPLSPDDRSRNSVMKGKTVTISGAAGKSAASGVRRALKNLLEIMSAKVVSGTGTGIALDAQAFRTGKLTLSEENLASLRQQTEELLASL